MKAATGKGALVDLHSGVPELALFLCFDSPHPPPGDDFQGSWFCAILRLWLMKYQRSTRMLGIFPGTS